MANKNNSKTARELSHERKDNFVKDIMDHDYRDPQAALEDRAKLEVLKYRDTQVSAPYVARVKKIDKAINKLDSILSEKISDGDITDDLFSQSGIVVETKFDIESKAKYTSKDVTNTILDLIDKLPTSDPYVPVLKSLIKQSLNGTKFKNIVASSIHELHPDLHHMVKFNDEVVSSVKIMEVSDED